MTLRACVGTLLIAGLSSGLEVSAHHSFAAEYDPNKPITLTGSVTKVDWRNPHVHINMDVKDQAGKVTSWDLELGGPNGLLRKGWTRNSLKSGDMIVMNGYAARDGSPLANAVTITLADGRKVFADSSAGTIDKAP